MFPEGQAKKNKTFYCILCEMSGYSYDGTRAEKSLAKALRKYFLDEMNSHTKNGRGNYYKPLFASDKAPFHGHFLSWKKEEWRRSAAIVYNYFKAETLIKCIRENEKRLEKTIIHDYNGMLEYFYKALSSDEEIDYWKAPGIDAAFELMDQKELDDKLRRFKELYE